MCRSDADHELARHAVPDAVLLRVLGAHVLPAEEGRDLAAHRQIVDQDRHTFDRRVNRQTWEPENNPDQVDSWKRIWRFLDRTLLERPALVATN